MDEARIEKAGLEPLTSLFERIRALKSGKDLAPLLALLHTQGIQAGPAFFVTLDDKDSQSVIARIAQGGLGLPEREFYFRKDKTTRDQRDAYVKHITRMFELAGLPAASARAQAIQAMALETRLAKVSRTLVALRDPESNYHKLSREAIAKLSPDFPWQNYFTDLGLPSSQGQLIVGQPEFLEGFSALVHGVPISHWKAYLQWHTLDGMAAFLGKAIEEVDFAFYGKILSGRKEMFPRWKRVLQALDRAIGEDLGQEFVKRTFSPQAKIQVLEMIRFHKVALAASIRRAPWMSEATKLQALRKLETMRAKVGFPDRWRDYSAMGLKREPYVLSAMRANLFEFQRRLGKLGKPVDRDEWDMTPQTNNAYYNPILNEIVLPAGILQPPFFDERADDASNYGALASTIGHEMLHGFDDQGSQYDAEGNLKNWWTPEDRKAYEAMTAQVAEQFDAYEPQPGLHINGKQTLGENLADIGGLKISLEAWKLATTGKPQATIDGLDPQQRFFVAFAQGWRTNTRPESLRLQVQSDVHSPIRWRVLGPTAVLPEFRQAFGCSVSGAKSFNIW
jgi:predicted metalloendopeptidase